MEKKVTHASLYLLTSLALAVSVQIFLLTTFAAPQPIFVLLHGRMFSLSVTSTLHKADQLFTFYNIAVLINQERNFAY